MLGYNVIKLSNLKEQSLCDTTKPVALNDLNNGKFEK